MIITIAMIIILLIAFISLISVLMDEVKDDINLHMDIMDDDDIDIDLEEEHLK